MKDEYLKFKDDESSENTGQKQKKSETNNMSKDQSKDISKDLDSIEEEDEFQKFIQKDLVVI